MKQHLRVIAFFISTSALLSCSQPSDFSYNNGNNGSFNEFKGQWLVINYWAEWCKPCIKEIPELNAVAIHPNINVIGINFDAMDAAKEHEIMQKLHIEYPVVKGDFHLHYHYDMPVALPTSIVINPQGKVVKVLLGPQSQADIEKIVVESAKF